MTDRQIQFALGLSALVAVAYVVFLLSTGVVVR